MTHPFSVVVYCGARPGKNPAYLAAAKALGAEIGDNGWRLVYGAGDAGIMGAVADAAKAKGGDTLGVIPTHLIHREAQGGPSGGTIITETMHERKKVLFLNADAVAILPGGAGSLDEFFEVLTWGQLGLHQKPIYLVNIEGYWSPLISLIDHVIDQEFADPGLRDLFQVVDNVAALTRALKSLQ